MAASGLFDQQHRHVSASALAAFIGDHPYQSMVSAWFDTLRRTDPLLTTQVISDVLAEREKQQMADSEKSRIAEREKQQIADSEQKNAENTEIDKDEPMTAAKIESTYLPSTCADTASIKEPQTTEDIDDAVAAKRQQISEAIVRAEAPPSLTEDVRAEIIKYAAVATQTSNLRSKLVGLTNTETEQVLELADKTAALVQTVATETESALNCSYGVAMEPVVLQTIPNATKDNKYKSMFVFETTQRHRWFIGGRTDGLIKDTEDTNKVLAIVEIKNRKTKLYSMVPTYERVQCECYMRIWGAPSLQFVQQLNSRAAATVGGQQQSTIVIQPSDALWSAVRGKLHRYAEFFDSVLLKDYDKLKWLARESMVDKSKQNDWVLRRWVIETQK